MSVGHNPVVLKALALCSEDCMCLNIVLRSNWIHFVHLNNPCMIFVGFFLLVCFGGAHTVLLRDYS